MEISTEDKRDLQLLVTEIETRLQDPQSEERDAWLTNATATLQAYEQSVGMGGTANGLAEQGSIPAGEDKVIGDLMEDVSFTAARNRAEDMKDFIHGQFLDDPEKKALATRRAIERAAYQLNLDADIRASGIKGTPHDFKVPLEFVGSLIPDLLASAVPGFGTAKTVGGVAARVAGEGVIGAVLGGSSVPLDQDQGGAAALGAAIGLGAGFISEVPGMAANFLKRELIAAKNSTRNDRWEKIADEAGIDLTLSERTGSPSVQAAELGVPARPEGPRAEFMAKRDAQVLKRFDSIVEDLNPQSMTMDQIVHATSVAYDDAISKLSFTASAKFRAGIEPGIRGIGAHLDEQGRLLGGFRFIETPNLQAELAKQLDMLSSQPLTGSTTAARKDLVNEIKQLGEKKLDIGQVQRMLKDLSGQNKPTGLVIKDNTKASDILDSKLVQQALNKDLDRIALQQDEFGEAILGLQSSRQQFGKDMAEIDVFKNRAVDQLLGKNGDPSAENFSKRIIAMDKRSFKELLDIADDADPELGMSIRAVVFDEMLDLRGVTSLAEATVEGGVRRVNVAEVMADMNRMPFTKFRALIGAGIEVQQARRIRNSFLALEAIANGVSESQPVVRGMRERFEQAAINFASRDQGFIARLIAGEWSPGAMEKLLFSPENQEALARLGTTNISRAEFANALNVILDVFRAEDDQKNAQAEADQGQRRQQAIDQVGNLSLGNIPL